LAIAIDSQLNFLKQLDNQHFRTRCPCFKQCY